MRVIITEDQLEKILGKIVIKEGLYGSNTDTVDYNLPEFLSDVIILGKLENLRDVKNSIKELHKRLMRLEKGLGQAGSHQKAYSSSGLYSAKNKKFKDFEKLDAESAERDDELQKNIDDMRQQFMDSARKTT